MGNFHLALMSDIGQNLVKIKMQYTDKKVFIKKGPLNIGLSVLAFEAKKGQNKVQRSVQPACC